MKKRILTLIEASINPQLFYEEKMTQVKYLSLILPAFAGLFSMLGIGIDRFSAGITDVKTVVYGCFFGLVMGLICVFFRAVAVKIISLFTHTEVYFQELTYAIGASSGIPLFISFLGFVLSAFTDIAMSSSAFVFSSMSSLIPLYYLIISLNLGGIKNRKLISLITVTCVGVIHLCVIRLLLSF